MAVNSADTEESNRPGLANDDVSREAAGKKKAKREELQNSEQKLTRIKKQVRLKVTI